MFPVSGRNDNSGAIDGMVGRHLLRVNVLKVVPAPVHPGELGHLCRRVLGFDVVPDRKIGHGCILNKTLRLYSLTDGKFRIGYRRVRINRMRVRIKNTKCLKLKNL